MVGEPGTSFSSNGVKRYAVETVWLQARWSVWPMITIGTPNRLAPLTFTLPGIVSCDSKKRSEPSHGKCGLPSTIPRPLSVASRPRP